MRNSLASSRLNASDTSRAPGVGHRWIGVHQAVPWPEDDDEDADLVEDDAEMNG